MPQSQRKLCQRGLEENKEKKKVPMTHVSEKPEEAAVFKRSTYKLHEVTILKYKTTENIQEFSLSQADDGKLSNIE